MKPLDNFVSINGIYARSVNLLRDINDLDIVQAYLPTSKALQTLEQFKLGFTNQSAERAYALIGPYGSGKSAFALFLSTLLAKNDCPVRQIANDKLRAIDPTTSVEFDKAIADGSGFLKISVNGTPDSLIRQLLLALADSVAQAGFDQSTVAAIKAAAVPTTPMQTVIAHLHAIQNSWAEMGGAGLLLTIDELGKFLEYESYHPQHREIHLLQLLAEHARQSHDAPLHVLVLLHQAFEYYTHRLGKHLREEWQKVQGRYNAVAFLEPAEQTLKVISAVFSQQQALPENLHTQLDEWTRELSSLGALPPNLSDAQTQGIFEQCYPLHPLTLLILPVLCQKIAQNERTLFSYLGSVGPLGLKSRLAELEWGAWILPAELYDYFISQQMGGFSDPLTYRRWLEVVTALERFDAAPDDLAVQLLKTIGLLNLIGSQRGLKASPELLRLLFGDQLDVMLKRLAAASIVHYRHYNQEFRVWQGSDFDLDEALTSTVNEFANQPIVPILNHQKPIPPMVARRVSIETGSLRSFSVRFASKTHPYNPNNNELVLLIYLTAEDEKPDTSQFAGQEIVAVCGFDQHEQLSETVLNKMALAELPKRYAALHQDPIAYREYLTWLSHAETETATRFMDLLADPGELTWYFNGEKQIVASRRDLQSRLSAWLETYCYPKAPVLRNELIIWEQPSASASTGRNRLIHAMLTAPGQDKLGISKTPAEMSLYLSLLKASRLHRYKESILGIYPPDELSDPCKLWPVWTGITEFLGDNGKQMPVTALYRYLQGRPYGIKQGVLPVLLIAYLLGYRREVALYQEGVYCAQLTMEQAEMLCKRPEFFALERFDLGGLRGELFDQYLNSVVGKIPTDATLLDIAKPLVNFASRLPDYTKQCKTLSPEAVRVMTAFTQAQSPGVLLFDALPIALGWAATDFLRGELAQIEPCIQKLVGALRELRGAYDLLLNDWHKSLSINLLQENHTDLVDLRQQLTDRYRGLEDYTPDKMGIGAFIRRLCDPGYPSDQAWLESTAALLGKVPPQKWTDANRIEAEIRLKERAGQMNELEKLRLDSPSSNNNSKALLVRLVDRENKTITKTVYPNEAQQEFASQRADQIADWDKLDENAQLTIIAELIKRCQTTFPTN